ncbi:MAG: hypothetical protein RLZZ241_1017, partial [Bacteroidota bacterium]|jgi:DNA ligase-associated metallophosphoesterase
MGVTIKVWEELLELHYTGAAYWKKKGILLISDLHLGKITHFRKHGAAVPHIAILKNIERLDQLISEYNPQLICFLGDLFHSHLNPEWDLFAQWAKMQKAKLILIRGNHDIISPEHYKDLGIRCQDRWNIGPFIFSHEPEIDDKTFNISGHIHPAVQLAGPGKQRLKLPCYFQKPNQLILPAFGAFTGTHTVSPEPQDSVFVLAEGEVIYLNPETLVAFSV